MDNQTHHLAEKREYQRSAVCKKIRFVVGTEKYSGLIGDISNGGISIISKHKFILGSVVDLKIPPMSGTGAVLRQLWKGLFQGWPATAGN